MAANDQQQHDDDAATNGQAEMAAHEATVAKADYDKLQKTLQEANRKAAADRKFREEYERAEEERKASQMGEAEKAARARQDAERRAQEAERKATEAERQFDELRLERKVEAAARTLKDGSSFEYPELVFGLIDRKRLSRDEDTGEWEGIEKELDRLARSYPNLVKQKRPAPSPPRDEHPGNGPRGAGRAGDQGRAIDIISDLRSKVNYPGR